MHGRAATGCLKNQNSPQALPVWFGQPRRSDRNRVMIRSGVLDKTFAFSTALALGARTIPYVRLLPVLNTGTTYLPYQYLCPMIPDAINPTDPLLVDAHSIDRMEQNISAEVHAALLTDLGAATTLLQLVKQDLLLGQL